MTVCAWTLRLVNRHRPCQDQGHLFPYALADLVVLHLHGLGEGLRFHSNAGQRSVGSPGGWSRLLELVGLDGLLAAILEPHHR